jgi:hypothetical protein
MSDNNSDPGANFITREVYLQSPLDKSYESELRDAGIAMRAAYAIGPKNLIPGAATTPGPNSAPVMQHISAYADHGSSYQSAGKKLRGEDSVERFKDEMRRSRQMWEGRNK